MTAKKVIIVGAGPAGMALAYLLARRGVGVTLLEKHLDFQRAFRGEGVQPSGLDVFQQMGLGEALERLPRASVRTLEFYRNGRLRARLSAAEAGVVACLISQPALLEMLAGEARRHPSFRLIHGATVRDELREDGRVVGVRADTPDGPRNYSADLVVGTDGRHSTLRKHGPFTELAAPQSFDVLWAKVPWVASWPDRATFRMEIGDGGLTGAIPASDGQLQIGFFIPKGGYQALRAMGGPDWTETLIRRVSPDLAAHLRAHREAVRRAVLLDVVVGRLTTWTAPGLLLLGDAAHPMSPIAGQGINLALRDALVAANHLCPVLVGGGDPAAIDAAARRVEAERLPEIVAVQEHQTRQARLFLEPQRLGSRLALRLLPFLVRTGLARLLLGRRLRAFAHGVVPVRLTI